LLGAIVKRIVFCFDGTWNALNANTPTNVVLTAASIVRDTKEGITQIIHYDEGVGTGRLEKWSGGMLGAGLIENVREAYRFLIFNYDPGDEIFVFGFSRGAFSAQTFVGFVRHVGPLRRLHAARIDEALDLYRERLTDAEGASDRMRKFRANYSSNVCVGAGDDAWRCQNVADYKQGSAPSLTIKYLGIWDTVEALGAPAVMPLSGLMNRKYAFHDASLNDFIESARHAVAIDERRALFQPVLWGDLTAINATRNAKPDDIDAPYQEKWFPGTHGSVGGGGDIRGLSDGALAWVLKGAKRTGLVLDAAAGSRIQGFEPNPLAPLVNVSQPEKSFTNVITKDRDGPDHLWQLSAAALRRWKAPSEDLPDQNAYRPKTLNKVATALASYVINAGHTDSIEILTEHVVVSGDQLGKLAKHYYDDAGKWKNIFDANRDTIDDADELFVGWKVRIPALPPSPTPLT
jgi:uncharacterized protein (DUF2235 family)